MGRRHHRARFKPNLYVFPGGCVEDCDRRPTGFDETLAPLPPGLDIVTRRRMVVFARTALRETFEETGLLVAAPGGSDRGCSESAPLGPVWTSYRRAGASPAFPLLRPLARAITPASSPLRFDTRFFLVADARLAGRLKGDGELEDLAWIPVEETADLPTPGVTRLVLQEALRRLRDTPGPARPLPSFA
jgi:8-oxo-dGTP pyrophosphatase MutT (NUDIX family)